MGDEGITSELQNKQQVPKVSSSLPSTGSCLENTMFYKLNINTNVFQGDGRGTEIRQFQLTQKRTTVV